MRDSASEAIIGIDLEGTIVSWNAGAEAIYGYEADEAVGEPISLLAPEAEEEEAMRPAAAAQLGERLDVPSTVHRHKDGGELAVSLTVAPIPNGAGEPTGAVVITRDIGEPQRAETRQRESEAKYRALTEHLPTITYVHPLGERGTPLYVSPQVGAILGYAADEWLAKPNLFFQLVHQDDRERVSAEIAAAAAGARPLRCEYRMLSRDGRVVWVHDEAVTVRDDDGRPLYVQGYLLDVSERRHAGEERERLLAAERAAAAEALDRQRKLDVLARAGEILASSPNYQATLRRVADLAVRDLADWCVVDLLDDDGTATRLAAAHSGPGMPPATSRGPPRARDPRGRARGKPGAHRVAHVRPLARAGRTLGALTLITRAPGPLLRRRRFRGRPGSRRDDRARHRQRPPHARGRGVRRRRPRAHLRRRRRRPRRPDRDDPPLEPGRRGDHRPHPRRGAGPRRRRRDRRLEGARRPHPGRHRGRSPCSPRPSRSRPSAASAGSRSPASTSSAASSTPSATSPTPAGSRS